MIRFNSEVCLPNCWCFGEKKLDPPNKWTSKASWTWTTLLICSLKLATNVYMAIQLTFTYLHIKCHTKWIRTRSGRERGRGGEWKKLPAKLFIYKSYLTRFFFRSFFPPRTFSILSISSGWELLTLIASSALAYVERRKTENSVPTEINIKIKNNEHSLSMSVLLLVNNDGKTEWTFSLLWLDSMVFSQSFIEWIQNLFLHLMNTHEVDKHLLTILVFCYFRQVEMSPILY